jgi:hypothetical protein
MVRRRRRRRSADLCITGSEKARCLAAAGKPDFDDISKSDRRKTLHYRFRHCKRAVPCCLFVSARKVPAHPEMLQFD